jgi:hypothetical protein
LKECYNLGEGKMLLSKQASPIVSVWLCQFLLTLYPDSSSCFSHNQVYSPFAWHGVLLGPWDQLWLKDMAEFQQFYLSLIFPPTGTGVELKALCLLGNFLPLVPCPHPFLL